MLDSTSLAVGGATGLGCAQAHRKVAVDTDTTVYFGVSYDDYSSCYSMVDIGLLLNCRRVIVVCASTNHRPTPVVRLAHLYCSWGADSHSVSHFNWYTGHFDDILLLLLLYG